MKFSDFKTLIDYAGLRLKTGGKRVEHQRWQGVSVEGKPDMQHHEILSFFGEAPMPTTNLDYYKSQILPNLPWADDHFEERICGYPINPGVQWKHWPYAHSAERFLDETGRFDHNYMERYWPQFAGRAEGPTKTAEDYRLELSNLCCYLPHSGIRHEYGDLLDLIDLLKRDPYTRQAWFPMFYPEDTGMRHQGRAPCSVGYHFIMRDNKLHVAYYLRSCDYVRHFRDDLYLTVRLMLWVLSKLQDANASWQDVQPGTFTVHAMSLHCFVNDTRDL